MFPLTVHEEFTRMPAAPFQLAGAYTTLFASVPVNPPVVTSAPYVPLLYRS